MYQDTGTRRPTIGVICCNKDVSGRAAQTVANRFLEPLKQLSEVNTLLIPAIPGLNDLRSLVDILDGVFLTGSFSNIDPRRYDKGRDRYPTADDGDRDGVAMRIGSIAINAGKPVFGICRGMQEINVMFGGSLTEHVDGHEGLHHYKQSEVVCYADHFNNTHSVSLAEDGIAARYLQTKQMQIVSAHRQGIDVLGAGLSIEASAPDGLIEAVSACPVAPVIGVQWHPEWRASNNVHSRAFFGMVGLAARGDRLTA